MQSLIKPILKYIAYPLIIKLGDFIYTKYIIGSIDHKYEIIQQKRDALSNAITNAKTNEDRKALSIILSDINKL